jgi:membrane protein DedA with SNARE-associated domain
MALESMCIPLPSEVIMPFAGYLASTGRFSLVLVGLVGALGCNIGSTIAYAVGYSGGRGLVLRWGRFLLIDKDELDRVDRFFHRYGSATVLISRVLPVIRTYIALPAGIARMNFWKFQIYTFIGSLPWTFALAYIGFKLGQKWDNSPALKSVMHKLDFVVIILIIAAIAWYFWKLRRARHRATVT